MKESLAVPLNDGSKLAVTQFIPERSDGQIVLICPSMGVSQEAYKSFAVHLASLGYRAYTFDYRGTGQSEHQRTHSLTIKDWVNDLDTLIAYIQRTHPALPIMILAHGASSTLAGLSSLSRYAALFMFINPQTPSIHFRPSFKSLAKVLQAYIGIPLFSRLSSYIGPWITGHSEKLPSSIAGQWNKWSKGKKVILQESAGGLTSMLDLSQPTLLVTSSDDDVACPSCADDVKRMYSNIKPTFWRLQPEEIMQKHFKHCCFFDARMKSLLWDELHQWIQQNLQRGSNAAA
jgi:predicted alpha/beta hydrolase